MKKYISEMRWEIEKEFNFNLSTQKIRRLEARGLFAVEREGDFRTYTEDDGDKIKMVVALNELGMKDREVKRVLEGGINAFTERIDTLRKLENYIKGRLYEGNHTDMPVEG